MKRRIQVNRSMSTPMILLTSSIFAFLIAVCIATFVIPPVDDIKKIAAEPERRAQQIELAKSVRGSAMLYVSWSLILSAAIVIVTEGKLSFLKQEFGFFRLGMIPFVLVFFFFSIYYGLSLNHSVTGFLATGCIAPNLAGPLHLDNWNKQFSFFILGLLILLSFLLSSIDTKKIKRIQNQKLKEVKK